LVDSLDAAFAVFNATSDNPEAALKDFVTNHYFKVWRGNSALQITAEGAQLPVPLPSAVV
jgi:hypothetical protein